MKYSAAIANQTGVSLEQLISYIGTVSQTTRQNAESIGQGMKTILTRLQDIKAGAIDEDGLGINNVEIALNGTGVALRDAQGEFRDFGDVLEELAGIWDTIGSKQQAYISKSIAGVRQVNMFTVLMNEMDTALAFQEEQLNATGLGVERYAIHMESLAAKQSQFTAALEEVYTGATGKATMAWFIDTGTAALKLVTSLGGIRALLPYIGAGLLVIKQNSLGIDKALNSAFAAKKIEAVTSSVNKLQAAQEVLSQKQVALFQQEALGRKAGNIQWNLANKAVNQASVAVETQTAAMKAAQLQATLTGLAMQLAFSAVVFAIASVVQHFIKLKEEQRQALQDAEAFSKEWEKTKGDNYSIDANKRKKSVGDLIEQYAELTKIVKRTKEQEEELRAVVEGIADIYPELGIEVEAILLTSGNQNTALTTQKEILEKILELEKARREEAERKTKQEVIDSFEGSQNALKEQESRVSEYQVKLENATDPKEREQLINALNGEIKYYNYLLDQLADQYKYAQDNEFDMELREPMEDMLKGDIKVLTDEGYQVGVTLGTAIIEGLRMPLNSFGEFFGTNFLQKLEPPVSDEFDRRLIDSWERSGEVAKEVANDIDMSFAKSLQSQVELTTQTNSLSKAIASVDGKNIKEISQTDFNFLIAQLGPTLDGLETTEDGLLSFNKEALKLNSEVQDLWDTLEKGGYVTGDITDEFIDSLFAIEDLTDSAKALKDAHEDLISGTDVLSSAMEEQGKNGFISAETAFEIARANGELGRSLIKVEGGYRLTTDAINTQKAALQNSLNAILNETEGVKYNANVKAILKQVATAAAQGNYILAMSAVEASKQALTEAGIFERLGDILGQFAKIDFAMPTFSGVDSGSGSGSREEDPRIAEYEEEIDKLEDQKKIHEKIIHEYEHQIHAIEDQIELFDHQIEKQEEIIENLEKQIDVYEKQKDAIEEARDAYHDMIDDKKDALNLAKSENDYYKDQQEKVKSLAQLQKEIAVISLDTSEEGRAKRLKLEEQAAEVRGGIGEDADERRHQLQLAALENLKESYDQIADAEIARLDGIIEGIQSQIDAAELIVEGINDQIKLQEDAIHEINHLIDQQRHLIEPIDHNIEDIRDILEDIRKNSEGSGSGSGSRGSGDMGGYKVIGQPTKGSGSVDVITDPKNPFGWSNLPVTNPTITQLEEGKTHGQGWAGVDMVGPNGAAPILSPGDMELYNSYWSDLYGNVVELLDPKTGTITQLSHMASIDPIAVAENIGKTISAGTVIGMMGNTGSTSQGVHLDVTAWQAQLDKATGEWVKGANLSGLEESFAEENIIRLNEYLGTAEDVVESMTNSSTSQLDKYTSAIADGTLTIQEAVSNGLVKGEEDYLLWSKVLSDGTLSVSEAMSLGLASSGSAAKALVDNISAGVVTISDAYALGLGNSGSAVANFASVMEDGVLTIDEAVASGAKGIDGSLSAIYVSIDGVITKLVYKIKTLANGMPGFEEETSTPTYKPYNPPIRPNRPGLDPTRPSQEIKHAGGTVGDSNGRGFVGNLQSNEVFAKLLKGEYVATEHQMDNFLRNVLPMIGANIPKVSSNFGGQNITVNMPITVEGNMDKAVMPQLEQISNKVIDNINKALVTRGYVRSANISLS